MIKELKLKPQYVTLFITLSIFTVLFAFIIFGELQLNLISALGFLLIIGGIVLVKLYAK